MAVNVDLSKGTYTVNGKTYKIKGGVGSQENADKLSSAAQNSGGKVNISGSYTPTTTKTNTNSGGDIYGDVSRNSTAGQNKSEGIATSGGLSYKPTSQQDLGDLAQFGADAYTMEGNKSGSLAKRNDIIANNLYLSGQGVEDYLNQFDSFKNASDADKSNTIRAINERLGIIKNNYGDNNGDLGLDKKGGEEDTGILGDRGYSDTTPGFYRDAEGNEIKIYGYQALSEDQKKYVDQMSDAEKKKISNMGANALQDYIKQYADSNYEKDYREKMYGLAKDMRDIQTQQEAIQYGQQLRQAEEQVNNLMQNWEYLGNMGMPGLSKVKLQAISDSIKEANTSLDEMVRLQNLAKEASAKNWEIDVAQYEKQISDIVRDLNYKIPQEIQNALNKYTVAELEGNLDTIDGVVAFKKSLLDDLDNNISGMTSASLQQMQYITDSYMQMADKAYEEAKLYKDNMNKVNTEMSSVKGYYVDGNGNAILDSDGLPIKIPQSSPMDPVFDKESGRLIQFYYNDDGSIGATYTQVYDGDQSNLQATVISMLEDGRYSAQDIAKFTGMDLDKVIEMQGKVNVINRPDGMPKVYGGKNYTSVDANTVQNVMNDFIANHQVGSNGGSCGHLANDYLEALGIGRLYGDYLYGHDSSDKTANMNSDVPVVGGIVVMDSPNCPDNGHVAIVTAIDPEKRTIDVLESNWKGDKQVHTNTYSLDSGSIYGFFDPSKSVDDYNRESSSGENGGGAGYKAVANLKNSKDNKSTENETQAFASRAWSSNDDMVAMENSSYRNRWNRNTREWLKSSDRKKYEALQNEFVNAVLRWESGAAIGETEFSADRKGAMERYFPVKGDSKEVIKMKQELRDNYIANMMKSAGRTENGDSWFDVYINNRIVSGGNGNNNSNNNNGGSNTVSDPYDRG